MARNSSTKKSGETLPPKQETFIFLLLGGVSIAASAKKVGVSETSAHRWLRDETFQRFYREAQRTLFDENLASLRIGVNEAVDILKSIAKDTESPAGVRVRAVEVWITRALEVGKMSELQARLEEIEAQLQERGIENGAIRRIG